jgi:dephospho-CoA kinase
LAARPHACDARRVTRIVGLSGGIGSGKSSVARMFASLGARVIDADAIVHELQAPNMPMLADIAAAFGSEMIDAEGRLDRARLGALVFRDAAARARLGAIVHPPVAAEIARRLEQARRDAVPLVVIDIPLLFEGRRAGTGSAAHLAFDATVLVWVSEPTQIERQMARDGCSRDEALRRIRAQLPLDEKRELADHVIDNSGTPEQTQRQVRALFEALMSRPQRAAAP